MLKQAMQWKSMCKGLVLGTLLTTCMILLYSFAAPPHQLNLQEVPVPYSCSYKPVHPRNVPQINNTLSTLEQSKACTLKEDIMFMKTHKTASSTILNILFRFGQRHRLKFAFPNGRNDFYYPSFFDRSQVKDYRPGTCFNIICNHMRFHSEEVHKLLPEDTVYFSILRNPAYLFESSFHYFGRVIPLTWKISGEDKLSEFLREPDRYYDPNGFNSHYLKNVLFFDFGYDNNLEFGDPRVEKYIKAIDERFQLVMLLEYFDESLILLKDVMCWNMDDILYFKLNIRKDSTISRMNGELYEKATRWNRIDSMLYGYFNATFWRKVRQYGFERMQHDVEELRERNDHMQSICIDGGRPVDANAIQEASLQPWQPLGERSIMGYNLKKNISRKHRKLCRKMLTPELQYLTELGVNLWITKLWSYIRDLFRW
ncbi:galactosylceramide sulfotransferase [Amblyraja radiata]|uniref:galactosylceramide sulfotransferase n=1 Tax=Amblyraja radiata TaxID=386614 RepID=UPI001403F464|nr:galactosylceramide sulfotransferase [Amblyraja radiata]XP_032899226.1 galactosylceramide sulfotransferase [Amblyraja radiata]